MTVSLSRFQSQHERDLAILTNAYVAGRASGASDLDPGEQVDRRILSEGVELRTERIVGARGKHAHSGIRAFFCLRSNPLNSWWWADMADALSHVGIPWSWASHDDPSLSERIDAFRPSLTLSLGVRSFLEGPAPGVLSSYKSGHSCLRLMLPDTPSRTKTGDLTKKEAERLKRDLNGDYADAHFSMFVREHYESTFGEWHLAGFPYFEMPFAANPRVHHTLASVKDLDYFMVASPEDHRPATAVECLAPIMSRYFGVWAGPGWPFGEGFLPPTATPAFYSRARIAPNPVHPGLVGSPADITHRTFAATACGAFVITLRTPITERFFGEDELISVEGAAAFIDAFDYYVARPAERNEIVLLGMQRVFREHTTFDRIDDLVRFAGGHADLA